MDGSQPTRMCVSCRRRAPQTALVRLALGTDGEVVVQQHRRQGRGAYVCPSRQCLTNAVKRGGVSRGLRAQGLLPTPEQIALSAATVVRSRLKRIARCPSAHLERERLTQLLEQLQASTQNAWSRPRPEGGLAKAHG